MAAAAFPATLAAVAEAAAAQQPPLPAPLPEAPLAAMPGAGLPSGGAPSPPPVPLTAESPWTRQLQEQHSGGTGGVERAAAAEEGPAAPSGPWVTLPHPEPAGSSPALPVQGADGMVQRPTFNQLQQVRGGQTDSSRHPRVCRSPPNMET